MSGKLRVATYNIRKCIGTDRKRDPERILRVLREIDADIIALQEADYRFGQRETSLPFRKIDSETPWKHVPFNMRPGALGWHGNAILVRDAMDIRNGHPLDLPMLEPRGGVVTEVETPLGLMRIIAVHLDLSGLWRRRQIRKILSFIENSRHHIPTVIMGDFNQWSDRGALSEFAFHRHRVLKTPKSFHSARPIAALDRIIVSHDLIPVDITCHQSMDAKKASDHLPIWADIKIA